MAGLLVMSEELQRALRNGDLRRTKELLAQGPVPVSLDYTLLSLAARRDDVSFLKALVESGRDVNARSGTAETPLMEAVRHGHGENIRYLLSQGANPALKNGDGRTAADFAEKILEQNILNLMSQVLDGVLRPEEQRLVDKWGHLASTLRTAEREALSTALKKDLPVRKPLHLRPREG